MYNSFCTLLFAKKRSNCSVKIRKILFTNINTILYKEHTLWKYMFGRQYKRQEIAVPQRNLKTTFIAKLYKNYNYIPFYCPLIGL